MTLRPRLASVVMLAALSVGTMADAKGWRTSASHRRQREAAASAAAAAAAAYASWYASLGPKERAVEDRRVDLRRQAAELRYRADRIRYEAAVRRQEACDRSWFGSGCRY
jgi:hypothetical protein